MATSIFLIGQDNALTELTQAPYDSEELLQRLLADHPSLLRGTSASGARLLLVCRELGIPDEHAGTDRWAIDHLFVDREGVPVLVEVKRASDTRSRREVVAQMLDYAANSVAYLPIDRIISLYAKSAQELGKDRDALLAEFLEDGDAESFWRRVEANLRAGRVRLVFVANRIPNSLRRIVEFHNEQMRPAEVLALELDQFATSSGVRTLVPHLIGNTQRAQVAKSVSASPPPMSETEILDGFDSDAKRGAAHHLFDWLREIGLDVGLIKGQKNISALVVVPGQKPVCVLTVDTYGKVWIGLGNLGAARAFTEPARRDEILSQFRALPGINLSSAQKYPSFPLEDLTPSDTWAGFQAVANDIVTRLRSDAT